MKRLFTTLFIVLGFLASQAQQTVSVSQEQMVFYSLTDGVTGSIALSDWDIAIEPQNDYAIRINEIKGARVWLKPDDVRENCNFLQTSCRGLQDHEPAPYDTTGMHSETNGWVEVHNGYQNWSEGALNQEQPFLSTDLQSFGWGGYKGFTSDPFHAILGYYIFVVRTQEGAYKQFFVRKSLSTGFEFAYANLDGTEVQDHTLAREDYENKLFAYVSLGQRQVRNVEPNLDSWDMVFTQYPEEKANGNYTVGYGILTNPTATIEAQTQNNANCISPQGNGSTNINTIGQSWSTGVGQVQQANPNARYFVERENGDVFQFGVLDFDVQAESYTLTNAPVLPTEITIDGVVDQVSCVACTDGAITIAVGGGTCPYQYSWSHGPQTADVSNLAPGSYTVTVTDNSGNTANKTFEVENFPCAISLSAVDRVQPSCFGTSDGSLSVTLENAAAPLTYNWSGGLQGNPLEGISAGDYTLQVTDANGCTLEADISLSQPDPLQLTASVEDENCFGCENGAVSLNVSGGNGGYTYVWSDGSTDGNRGGLAPASYNLTITDSKGCALDTSFTIAPYTCSDFIFRPTTQQPSCSDAADGIIGIAEITGGEAPYSYLWESGETTATLSDVPAGTYTVTVTDSKNCAQSIELSLDAPDPIFVSLEKVDESCAQCEDGSLAVDSISGGTAPYNYAWSNGESTNAVTGLAPGVYILTVTDANGCTTTIQRRIQEFGCALSILNVDAQEPSCFGFNDGELSLDLSGGNGNLTFEWSNGTNQQFASRLTAGEYTVVATDETGCADTATVTLGQPDSLATTLRYQGPSCGTCSDALLTVIPEGGTAPYSYAWNTGEQSQSINVETGDYTIEVTDDNGCVAFRDTSLEVVSSIADLAASSVRFYPNPVDAVLNIEVDPTQVARLELTNLMGQTVQLIAVQGAVNQFAMQDLPAGAYVVRVWSTQGTESRYTVMKR